MYFDQFKSLRTGDIVSHKSKYDIGIYVVTANYGNRVTAVRTVDITNPYEWDLISRCRRKYEAIKTSKRNIKNFKIEKP